MSEQIFISYRRIGGDTTAKLICEALKNHGYSVFYDYDSIQGGYFDSRIYTAIENCNDFVLVLPPNALDRCVNEDDWIRLEIRHALKYRKNIIPVMLSGFSFPSNLPWDIASVTRYNGIEFSLPYFDAVIEAIIRHLTSKSGEFFAPPPVQTQARESTLNNGLIFTLNYSGTAYSVTRGDDCAKKLIIPEYYNGKPVTEVGDHEHGKMHPVKNSLFSARSPYDDNIREVYIPNSITNLGESAFGYCRYLTQVNIPGSVKRIGSLAFADCSALSQVTISDGVSGIDSCAFMRCSSLTQISVPRSITWIGNSAFAFCSSLSRVTLTNGITTLSNMIFYECTSLAEITIPRSITVIGDAVLKGCKSLRHINFEGTVREWKNIRTGKDWHPWSIRTVRCSDGNCWI